MPEMYDDFGHFLVAYLTAMRDSTGNTPLALSLQNEPRYTQPFNSCQYNPTSYRNVHSTAVPIIKAAFPNLQFFGTDDNASSSYHLSQWDAFLNPMLTDANLRNLIDILAIHYGSQAGYQHVWDMARPYGKKVWGSEETHDNSFMGQANRIHYALETGHASGWVIWTLASLFGDDADEYSRAPRDIYFGCKHFYRFIRPGAVRVGVSGQGSLKVTAFKHNTDNTTTVVIVNSGGSANVTVSGSGLPGQFHIYQTAGSNRCVHVGTTQPGSSFSVPGSSVTTLYNEDVTQSVRPPERSFTSARPVPVRRDIRVFTLDGRSVGTMPGRYDARGARMLLGQRGAQLQLLLGTP
jgi:O-glycosyl hydrolase